MGEGTGVPGFPFGDWIAGRWHAGALLRRARQGASLVIVGLLLTLGSATTHAHRGLALPEGVAGIVGGPTRSIAGWTDFCRRVPDECAIDPAEPRRIPLTLAVWRTLRSVNARVNARIKPMTDLAHWGLADRWDFPDDGFGDCEDYQLLKRRMLAERGLPRRALLMTVVIDDINEGHAVLTVRTDRGDFILDNKTDEIRPWKRVPYSFIKRAGQDGTAWVSLEETGRDGPRDSIAGAKVATAEP
ncbi:transglutaminase-like cysteine peptidase [Methylobacterium sp. J-076]|uniref:transglutaminase-like cysteine peptidase n=1 Tax=Methylobacterium sp. J-076 TaxID=2836655 RepID=UPI001FBBB71E|nr:transglutaminase-like cysteine peptidase [Methylobacterium sp. J-076]MCJ2011177.1 transglutaminase-like cysteine peptidase [Methylobacterium sp. J-076]